MAVQLDADICYRAIRSRDPRFDGRFFTAVRTTGVYCRPICPALPKRENCLFLASAAAAQEAGYRPCLRCRPEASPGTPAWLGTSATVSRALRLIADGALDRGSVDEMAARLGLGERHLRRLFQRHLGAAPLAVAQTRRILFAKKLLDETNLPMAQIAHAAGFSSLRRFNEVIGKCYARTPSSLRRAAHGSEFPSEVNAIALALPYRPPLEWRALLDYLALRATPGVERCERESYHRTIRIGESVGRVSVRQGRAQNQLVATLVLPPGAELVVVAERLRRIFDLGADPQVIADSLSSDPQLGPLVAARPGLRVPGAWDGFELAVRAILGQQVSVAAASTLAGRLAARFGEALDPELANGSGLSHLFPTPEALMNDDVAEIGLPKTRARAIRGLARAVASGALDLAASRGESSHAALRALPGIGDWTAQYVAMRALREPDAFPAGDLGLRRALGAQLGPLGPLGERALEEHSQRWRPWRAYAALHLWSAHGGDPARSRYPRRH